MPGLVAICKNAVESRFMEHYVQLKKRVSPFLQNSSQNCPVNRGSDMLKYYRVLQVHANETNLIFLLSLKYSGKNDLPTLYILQNHNAKCCKTACKTRVVQFYCNLPKQAQLNTEAKERLKDIIFCKNVDLKENENSFYACRLEFSGLEIESTIFSSA